jgi:GNAT superfamily N-acetyltransferase
MSLRSKEIAAAKRMSLRDYVDADRPQVWPIIEEVVRAGDTLPYPVVSQRARGMGVGRALVGDSLAWARGAGYAALRI